MNPRLFSTGSSKLFVLMLWWAATGCTNISSNGLEASSVLSCPGDGGLSPSPNLPQAIVRYSKFAISEQAFTAKKGVATMSSRKPLSAIVNEDCVLNNSNASKPISDLLRERIAAQPNVLKERAYTLELPFEISASKIRGMAESDECLLSVSEEIFVYSNTTTVNDPHFSYQLHLPAIKAPTAWDTFYESISGNVLVAVIDDGFDMTHPDLSPVTWVNPGEIAGNSIDDDGNGYIDDINGYNFSSNIPSPAPQQGSAHGTHVAGLIGAKDNNSVGVTGVMGRNIRIMALNTAGTNAGSSTTNIINALNYAVAKGAKVINISLGGPGSPTGPVGVALANAAAGGAFVAIAAGNSTQLITNSNFVSPAGHGKDIEGVMAVGALYADSLLQTSYTNYSSTYVEIGAPGSNDASEGLASTIPGADYDFFDGTSMASPVLAGAAALLVGWAQSRGITLTPAQIESAILSSADSKASLTSYFKNGGILNLENLASQTKCF